jgi:hypothetical protein
MFACHSTFGFHLRGFIQPGAMLAKERGRALLSPTRAPTSFAHFSIIKIATTTNYITALPSTPSKVAPPAAQTPIPKSVVLGDELPYKLPGGFELKGLGAQALALGLKFPLQGSVSLGAPVWPFLPKGTSLGAPVRPFLAQSAASPGATVRRSPLSSPSAACYISPRLAAQRSSDPRLIEGVQMFTSLLAASCGARVKLVNDTAWASHDFFVFYRDQKDPAVSQGERLVDFAALGSSVAGVLAGIFHTQWLDQASSCLNFTALVGDHLLSGKLTFSQSELLQLSSAPGAEEYSNIVGLAELVLPST